MKKPTDIFRTDDIVQHANMILGSA